MSVKARTIDNLGLDTSVRYAKDKEQLDLRMIDESRWVPKKIEVSVTRPYVPSEYDKLFSMSRHVQWAFFTEPPNYETQTRALFSYQIAPSLGSYEKQEEETEKLELASKEREEKKQKKGQGQGQQQKEEDRERQTLLALFKCIDKLDRMLTFINSRRNQYQRG